MIEAREDEVKKYELLDKYAIISCKAYDKQYVGYCYREHTEFKIDSGWRFVFGDEDEDYLENPDNALTMDLIDLINWKPELKQIINEQYNSEFEWNAESATFVEI